jgi:hypothetical protein
MQAQMGWGVSVEVSELTIADDSTFSGQTASRCRRCIHRSRVFPAASRRGESHKARSEQTRHPDRDEILCTVDLLLSIGSSVEELLSHLDMARHSDLLVSLPRLTE